MAKRDNLEKYFKKILKEGELSEEEWMIPSDDLWEAAKVHFPKKKKKDRAIFFWWGIGVLVLGLGIGITFYLSNGEGGKESLIAIIDENTEEQNIQKEATKTQKTIEGPNSIEEAIAKEDVKEQLDIIKKKVLAPIENTGIKNSPRTNKFVPNKKVEIITNAHQKKSVDELQSQHINTKTHEPLIPRSLIPSSENKTPKARKIFASPILKTSISFLEIAQRELDMPIAAPMIVNPAPKNTPKWEVGVSYAPFVLIQESILNNGLESPYEEETLGVKHQNLNLSIRRYVSPQFSISSGLYLSKGTLDVSFSDKVIYEDRTTNSLRSFLKETNSKNTVNLLGLGLDVDASIDYLADANLSNGDELIAKVGVPFNLKFVQLPFLFNWHFGKGKLKGWIHSGVSLDYLQVQASNLDFALFKENQLLTEPIIVEPLNEQTWKARGLAGFGMRYKITNHFQVGAGLHINMSDLILSRYDFGVYYGF